MESRGDGRMAKGGQEVLVCIDFICIVLVEHYI